jgi:hypothetical protein
VVRSSTALRHTITAAPAHSGPASTNHAALLATDADETMRSQPLSVHEASSDLDSHPSQVSDIEDSVNDKSSTTSYVWFGSGQHRHIPETRPRAGRADVHLYSVGVHPR